MDCKNTIVCHTMTYSGTEYRKNLYVMIKEDERGVIRGRIMLLLIKQVVEKEVFLVLQLVPAEQLVKFDVYHLSDDDSSIVLCCAMETLLDYYPPSSHEVDDLALLSLHHTFASNFSWPLCPITNSKFLELYFMLASELNICCIVCFGSITINSICDNCKHSL